MLTLNQHIALFRSFANNHSQINSFSQGSISQLTDAEHSTEESRLLYPMMFMEINPASVSGNTFVRNYTFYFHDILQKGSENEFEVLSDMQLVALDLLAWLKQNSSAQVSFDQNSTLTDFVRVFNDFLAGWTVTVSVREAMTYNKCDIPFKTE